MSLSDCSWSCHTRTCGTGPGQPESSHSRVEQSGISTEDDDLGYLREREYLTLARVRIAQGRGDRQVHSYQTPCACWSASSDAEAKARMGSALEILMLQALALSARRNRASALTTLHACLSLAAPEGYIRLFVDKGAPMLNLLQESQARGMAPDYVATLLSAFGASTRLPLLLPSLRKDSPGASHSARTRGAAVAGCRSLQW